MRKATSGIDYTSRDYRAFKELLIQKLQEKMPEYTDTSETDAGIVILESFANGLDICSYYIDAIANDVILATTQDRRIACILARPLGYVPYNQTSSIIPMVFKLESAQPEDVVIGRGTIVTTEESEDIEAIYFEVTEDLVIPAGKLGDEKDENGIYLYTVPAKQGEVVDEDYIGSSIGTAYQTFQLTYSEVLLDTLEVYVDEGDGEEKWTRVNSFVDSGLSDKVYIATVDDYDTCYIEFGNGIKGKVPSAFDNGIKAVYKTGGGTIGNVKEKTVTVLETDVAYVDSCFNLEPTTLGHDKESLEEIKYNAPANWRTRDRAVILKDYEDLLKINVSLFNSFYGLLNTKAIRDDTDRLKVDLYYQMREDYIMDDTLLKDISDFFSRRTMIGTTYEMIAYTPYVVDLEGVLIVADDYKADEVKSEVEDHITSYFQYGNFTFCDELVKSELEEDVKNTVDGVKSLRINSPLNDIIVSDSDNKIITLGKLTITI